MARPVKADAAETRRKVLAAAIAMFGEHGADGVSVRAIGGAAGVSLATVHHYFGSKDDLYRACVDAMYDELVGMRPALADAIRDAGSADQLIDRVVRAAFRFACAHQVEMRLLMREVVATGHLPDDRRERGQLPFLSEIAELIAARFDRTLIEIRLSLQSVAFLITRFAISSDTELELFTRATGDHARTAIEDHLVRVATAIFQ
jgi:AcrR family transcriptional regulator